MASAISVAALPAIAQEGSADDLGAMSISLKDVVIPPLAFKGLCKALAIKGLRFSSSLLSMQNRPLNPLIVSLLLGFDQPGLVRMLVTYFNDLIA